MDTGELTGAGKEIYEWVLQASTCRTIRGYEEYGDDYYNSIATNNTGTGVTTYIGSGNIVTSPTVSVYDDEDLIKFNILKNELDLNSIEDDWLKHHYSTAMSIFDFLTVESNMSEEAKEFAKADIEALMDDEDLDIDDLLRLIHGMDKKCQAKFIYTAMLKVDSDFTNLIKEEYLGTSSKNIMFSDISVGEGNPVMVAGIGARTMPILQEIEGTGEQAIVVEFQNE